MWETHFRCPSASQFLVFFTADCTKTETFTNDTLSESSSKGLMSHSVLSISSIVIYLSNLSPWLCHFWCDLGQIKVPCSSVTFLRHCFRPTVEFKSLDYGAWLLLGQSPNSPVASLLWISGVCAGHQCRLGIGHLGELAIPLFKINEQTKLTK